MDCPFAVPFFLSFLPSFAWLGSACFLLMSSSMLLPSAPFFPSLPLRLESVRASASSLASELLPAGNVTGGV